MTNQEFALNRLDWPESPLIEKKSEKDHADWPKTLVAFANSTGENERAILFIGASNQRPHKGISTAKAIDEIQLRVSNIAKDKCYPSIKVEFAPFTIEQDGEECRLLAVIVPASTTRPHFAGGAFIRDGSKSRSASEDTYKDLIASHNEVAGKLLRWKKKQIGPWHCGHCPLGARLPPHHHAG
jgi:predicted HTH transcriptional regulator